MKATYTNPPYDAPVNAELASEFLSAALVHAGSEQTLVDLFNEARRSKDPCASWWKIHDMAAYSALWRTGASPTEHKNAMYVLEVK